MKTNMNKIKPNGDPKTRQKHPKQELHQKKNNTKTKKFTWKTPESHLIFSKTHNPLPFTFTTNENSTKPNGDPKHVKNTPNKNRIKPQNERKTQKP